MILPCPTGIHCRGTDYPVSNYSSELGDALIYVSESWQNQITPPGIPTNIINSSVVDIDPPIGPNINNAPNNVPITPLGGCFGIGEGTTPQAAGGAAVGEALSCGGVNPNGNAFNNPTTDGGVANGPSQIPQNYGGGGGPGSSTTNPNVIVGGSIQPQKPFACVPNWDWIIAVLDDPSLIPFPPSVTYTVQGQGGAAQDWQFTITGLPGNSSYEKTGPNTVRLDLIGFDSCGNYDITVRASRTNLSFIQATCSDVLTLFGINDPDEGGTYVGFKGVTVFQLLPASPGQPYAAHISVCLGDKGPYTMQQKLNPDPMFDAMPSWLTLTPGPDGTGQQKNWVLSGTPSDADCMTTKTFVLSVTSSTGHSCWRPFQIPVSCDITGTPPDGKTCQAYDYTFNTCPPSLPATAVFDGSVPSGLILEPTGRVHGTPTQPISGVETISLKIIDPTIGPDALCSKNFNIFITGTSDGIARAAHDIIWTAGSFQGGPPGCGGVSAGVPTSNFSQIIPSAQSCWQDPNDIYNIGMYNSYVEVSGKLELCDGYINGDPTSPYYGTNQYLLTITIEAVWKNPDNPHNNTPPPGDPPDYVYGSQVQFDFWISGAQQWQVLESPQDSDKHTYSFGMTLLMSPGQLYYFTLFVGAAGPGFAQANLTLSPAYPP